MIILPVYRKWSWRDPPVITLLLVAINVMVFFGAQLDDDPAFIDAVDYYVANNMSDIELPLYGDYLKENNLELTLGIADGGVAAFGEAELVMTLYSDPAFVEGLPARVATAYSHVELDRWREHHNVFRQKLSSVTWFYYSFRPARPDLLTAFTHMFLHADLMHLLGNMVFLMVVGYVVEQIIGRSRFLLLYILCGMIPAGIEVLLTPDRWIPGLGASGAISGVMGMYAVLFGLRKIRFFYHVLFYFNYITLPAISVLPFWIGYEVWQMMAWPNSGVNNLAHAGGMAAGAVLVALLRLRPAAINAEVLDADSTAARKTDDYAKITDLMEKMEYDRAVRAVMRLNDWRNDPKLLPTLGAAWDHLQDRDLKRLTAITLLSYQTTESKLVEQQKNAFVGYLREEKTLPKNLLPVLVPLAKNFIAERFLDEAAILVAILLKVAAADRRLPDLIYALALAWRKQRNQPEFEKYRALLQKRFPTSDACRAIGAA